MRESIFLYHSVGRFLPAVVAALFVVGGLLFGLRARHGSRVEAFRTTGLDVGLAVWLGLILLVTVVPFGHSDERPPIGWIPFLDAIQRIRNGDSYPSAELSDIVLNILLFMPLGIGAALRWGRRRWLVIVVGAGLLSLAIETTQAIQATGRFASATDVFDNTLGAALGFALGLRLEDLGNGPPDEGPPGP